MGRWTGGQRDVRLLSELVHHLAAEDAIGETREVLDVGRGRELATGSEAVGHHALEQHGLELSPAEVNRSRVTGRSRATAKKERSAKVRRHRPGSAEEAEQRIGGGRAMLREQGGASARHVDLQGALLMTRIHARD